jgi:hypothetical protein
MATAPTIDQIPSNQERSRMQSRVKSVEDSFNSVKPVLRDIGEYMAPYRGRFETANLGQNQRGKRKGLKIINNVAGRSFSILSSGMMSGLTSPGRPWFKLATPDPDLAKYTPHRQWLDGVGRAMQTLFAKSNLYNVLPSLYGELAPFGTGCLQEVEDAQSIIRFYPYTIGEYGLAQDNRLVVDTFTRQYVDTVRNVVATWGNSPGLSERTRTLYRTGKLEDSVHLIHIIEPNQDRKVGGFGYRDMPFVEEYWEAMGDSQEPLERRGLAERALFAPRWDVTGNDLWGKGLGHDILGDVKQLQFKERRSEDVLEKHTSPPLEAGAALRGKRLSLLAGDVTYTDPANTGGTGVRPIVQTHPQAFQYATQNIGEMERRIRSACYEDLFLMLANDTRSGITAREVEERHQEKMLVLGPVLERLNEELLDPIIDRTFAIMQRRSEPFWKGMIDGNPLIPPPPKGLENEALSVEYTSILAQAARATNTRGIEAFGMFVGNLAAVWPEVLDKVNADNLVNEYADAQGIPAGIMSTDEEIMAKRAAKAQQQQQAQFAAMAPAIEQTANALKTAGEAVPQDGSTLSNIAQQAGASGLAVPLN